MKFTIENEQEEDGRWLAAVSELPGVAYGATAEEAMAKAELLALRVIAERLGYYCKVAGGITHGATDYSL